MIVRVDSTPHLEELITRIGRELAASTDRRRPWPLSPRWWDDWLLQWASADDRTKVQLFRFVDVLPTLTSAEEVADHFHSYFQHEAGNFPAPIRVAANLASPTSPTRNLVGRMIQAGTTRMARQFVAGSSLDQIAKRLRRQWDQGFAFTLDVLGEATITEKEADLYRDEYLALLERLGPETRQWPRKDRLEQASYGWVPRLNLSIKVSALFSLFDPIDEPGTIKGVGARLREILRQARQQGAHINLDMEQYAYKDVTLALFREVLSEPEFADWPDIGLAMQAYLKDTERDLHELADWVKRRGTPITVRLVKGAYWDYETVMAEQRHWPVPVFTEKWRSDASFERCAAYLMSHAEWFRPAIASHNLRSLAHALAVAQDLEVPRTDYEIQMLYGMAEPFQHAFASRGERLRIYTPYGKLLPGMAYLVRRLLENSSNSSFLHQAFRSHRSLEELLLPPHSPPTPSPVEKNMVTMPKTARMSEQSPIVNEPVLDFSLRTSRELMLHALSDVRHRLGRHENLWIGGHAIETAEHLVSVNPANFHETIGVFARAKRRHADEAVAAAKHALPKWSREPVDKRASCVERIADALRRHRTELAAWEVLECGKQWREADADVTEAIDFCEYYARGMRSLGQTKRRREPGEDDYYEYRARGVTAVIAPWNFPLAILCGMTMAPLVAGNPVIIKPAEQSSIIAARFVELIRESADLPPGVLNFLPGIGEEVGARLVEHPDVAIINFTGSKSVGLAIARTAAVTPPGQRHLKHVLAEMGGKNAIIVDNDADLDEAVMGVVRSAFGYQGQKCSACSRVIVLPNIYTTFVERLRDATASLTIGPPENPSYSMGPVIDETSHKRLHEVIDLGKREAECIYAGDVSAIEDTGYYVAPHLFANVSPSHRLAQEEFFGPILTILKASDIGEAIEIANGTDYALTGGVYSRNPGHIERVRSEMEVGNLYINRKITGAEVDRQPFGGYRLSGTGSKAGGPEYLHHFLLARTVTENTLRRGFAPEED